MQFANKLRALRKEKGWSQEELAEKLGVSLRTIVNYEKGQTYPRNRNLYDKIAELFDIKKDEEIYIRVKGKCEGSFGFRILINNVEGKRTSEYYYTGKLENGDFEYSLFLKAEETSNYITIRRPISTINIDKITLTLIEVKTESGTKFLDPEEGIILE